jgi:hypothetical protein
MLYLTAFIVKWRHNMKIGLFKAGIQGSEVPTYEINYEQVNTFADLPDPATVANDVYIVRTATGTWFLGTQKKAGLYYSNGVSWSYMGNSVSIDDTAISNESVWSSGKTNTEIGTKISASEKGAINGVATLDSSGLVPTSQLPSYVDDVLEYATYSALPTTGETGKIYVVITDETNNGKTTQYRWSGSAYTIITDGKATWGSIDGAISDQTDLNNALNAKVTKVTSTDNAIVRFNGTTGEVQNSGVVIDDSGNVGIGVSSPEKALSVNGASGIAIMNIATTGRRWNIKNDGNFVVGNYVSDPNVVTSNLTIDSSGNVGIGVTPSVWESATSAIEIRSKGCGVDVRGAGVTTELLNNAVYTPTGYQYGITKTASFYQLYNGGHTWYTAPSGTAGNPIAWTTAMTLDNSGKLTVNGFTKLGSDAPAIKYKKFTGTTASTEGGLVSIAHGLTQSKILSVQVLITSGNTYPPNYTFTNGYEYQVYFGGINIQVQNHATNSENILSKPFTVLVAYEE